MKPLDRFPEVQRARRQITDELIAATVQRALDLQNCRIWVDIDATDSPVSASINVKTVYGEVDFAVTPDGDLIATAFHPSPIYA